MMPMINDKCAFLSFRAQRSGVEKSNKIDFSTSFVPTGLTPVEMTILQIFAALIVTLIPSIARADRGAIVAVENVDLKEPAQRALIAHNGLEEILILQTDVQADKTAKVVEFMPLPSKPVVSLAAEDCFKALQELIEKYKLRYVIRYRGKNTEEQLDQSSAVKLVVSEQLGPHQVSVVEVNDVDKFIEWVEQFFKKNDLGKPNLGGKLRKIVKSYLDDEIRFFAFDVITVTNEKKTVQPLIYRFKSADLYYPLRVTNLYGGTGTIELLMITPKDVSSPWSVYMMPDSGYSIVNGKIAYTFIRSEMAEPNEGELRRIEPSIAALVNEEGPILRAVKYEGPLVFREDVKVPIEYSWAEILVKRFFKSLDDGDIERLSTLVTVPFAFDRKWVIEDKKELMEKFAEVLQKTKGSGISSSTFNMTALENYPFSDDFNKVFADKNLWRTADQVIVAKYKEESIVLFLHYVDHGCKIVGFSD